MEGANTIDFPSDFVDLSILYYTGTGKAGGSTVVYDLQTSQEVAADPLVFLVCLKITSHYIALTVLESLCRPG